MKRRRSAETMERYAANEREEYQLLKAAGLCPRCKGPPKPGRVMCAACIADVIAYGKRHHAEQRARHRRYRKEQFHARKQAGLCVLCGRARAGDTQKCEPCRLAYNERHRPGATTGKAYTCALCHGKGHDKRTCPVPAAVEHTLTIEHYAAARQPWV